MVAGGGHSAVETVVRGTTPLTLDCDCCGDVAAYSRPDGLFYEGDADRCRSCGCPGRVRVKDDGDGESRAYWSAACAHAEATP